MQLRAEDITIAVTVYRRLEYIESALDSAVDQTVPVKVVLYDDGCQDLPRLQRILAKYGSRVEYRKNPKSLGLFGNMNAGIFQCETEWISVLHDDDRVSRDFVERVLEAAKEVDRCSLFCGGTIYMAPDGRNFHQTTLPDEGRPRRISPEEFAVRNWFAFPGQLMHAPTARAVGGFPTKSIYTGDWELWFRLALEDGVVFVPAHTGYHRLHLGADRGTVAAAKTGRKAACCGMQVKRNFSRLRQKGSSARFDRRAWVQVYRPMYRDLLVYSWKMHPWLLNYNRRLMLFAPPVGRVTRTLQLLSRYFGNPVLRLGGLARSLSIRAGREAPQPF